MGLMGDRVTLGLNSWKNVLRYVYTNTGAFMKAIDVFSARDLRNRSGSLLGNAERGDLSIITKHGRPTAIAIPFDSDLMEQGVHRRLAVQLFSMRLATLSQAAKIANLPIEDFLDLLRMSGVSAVDYPAGEVAEELDQMA
jgi:prevent-host-death family protein